MKSKNSTSLFKIGKICLAVLTLSTIVSSCASYKKVPYFQDLDRSKVITEEITNMSPLIIQPEDRLSISVTSLNQDAANVFTNNIQNAGTDAENSVYGYVVNNKGEITLPLLGVVKVSDLSSSQLADKLQQQLTTYLSKPNVSVKIVSFKVAVLGDVLRPNIYRSSSDRLTITEALSLAGDLNITAKRDDITLVREIDGKRTYIPINLNSKDLFTSPYFYMKSNDLLFVQPGKLKLATVDTGYRNASLIISALSLIAIAVSLFTN
ncbi:polysaccharide biosynthesis/export family protein [Mucilaginibacter terrae]|uniref:Polysaccharide export outer membrane protein n=1 Tax=Mucilaginibacter terrae TaxID=1955052 RepID=A0ABU3GT98_9SPHI|nr:polysaccharide biosynthesis/export family protein [Mucilaginibacter terrae]MDT3402187.1 polysaccharide export outer membrane protein [Mucilaginibacter terrae]